VSPDPKYLQSSDFVVDSRTPPAPPRKVTGQYLARNRLNARARGQLVADIKNGKTVIDTSTLTIRQVVMLCRANLVYANEARFPERVKRRQIKKLKIVFDAIGPSARGEACREIGIERVWSALSAAL
jgi:hypothetical protein